MLYKISGMQSAESCNDDYCTHYWSCPAAPTGGQWVENSCYLPKLGRVTFNPFICILQMMSPHLHCLCDDTGNQHQVLEGKTCVILQMGLLGGSPESQQKVAMMIIVPIIGAAQLPQLVDSGWKTPVTSPSQDELRLILLFAFFR